MNKILVNHDYWRGLYLDFEGEGLKSGTKTPPVPHFAGVYCPDRDLPASARYSVTAFRETWHPVKNGCPEVTDIKPIKDFLWQLIFKAMRYDRTIFYWTCHELAVVRSLGDQKLTAAFEAISENIKPIARKAINRRRLTISKDSPKGLNNYLAALAPKCTPVGELEMGAAEGCRRLDKYSTKNKRWSKWTDLQKDTARSLVTYNREDCVALYEIAKRALLKPARERNVPAETSQSRLNGHGRVS